MLIHEQVEERDCGWPALGITSLARILLNAAWPPSYDGEGQGEN